MAKILMYRKSITIIVSVTLLCSCGNSSRNNSKYASSNDYSTTEVGEEDGRGGYDEYLDAEEEGTPDIGNIRLTGEIVQCNKCMGYGMVQNGMYGQPEICKFCWISTYMRMQQGWTGFDGRYGQVDAVFNTLPADYFDGLDWNAYSEYDNNGGGNSRPCGCYLLKVCHVGYHSCIDVVCSGTRKIVLQRCRHSISLKK